MDYNKALEKLEALRREIDKDRAAQPGRPEEERANLAILYGECEPIITQILGVQEVTLDARHGAKERYSNLIEAGYLSSRTSHRYSGYHQLLKVIGRVRQLAEDPAGPMPPASVSQLIQTVRRFRLPSRCCPGSSTRRPA